MKPLTNAEIQQIATQLLTGFGQEYEWDSLGATAADINLALDIGTGLAVRKVAVEVVRLAEDRGLTEMLLREAALRRPKKISIQALAAQYGLAPAPIANVRVLSDAGTPVALPASERSNYERMLLDQAGTAKPGEWRSQMAAREAAVCQVLFRGDAIGTGFLVAPDLVMSNWHVFEAWENKKPTGQLGELGDYTARFDYRAAAGTAPASIGTQIAIEAAAGYLASSEKTRLDYVLVRLASAIGREALANGAQRGWLRPATREFQPLEAMLVLQHPKGRTLELAIGPVMSWVDKREHEIYTHYTNTDEGSSGSPCFTCKWELAAIHHRGDPDVANGPNRAIAMPAVLQDMAFNTTIGLIPEVV